MTTTHDVFNSCKEGDLNRLKTYDLSTINLLRDEHFMHVAIKNNRIGIINYLLGKGYCNVLDGNDRTPLHIAISLNNKGLVKKLIKTYKCNLNLKDKFGDTPLHYAVLHNLYYMVLYLKEQGASFNIENNKGRTALYYAKFYNYGKIVNFLIKSV